MRDEDAKKFICWLEGVKCFLPPKMSLYEARLLWERKKIEDKELAHEEDI